jgi:pimeloyl-ACP methyl ester carboxylesterase
MVSRRAGLLHLKEGATVAYQRWSALDQTPPINQKRILALHGWLDNSNSYSYLGSHLARQGFDFVAIDVPGHGLSSHLHGGVHFLSYCVETIKMVLESLEWTKDEQKSNIIGHSMGAGISMIFHGTYPELVEKSVLIDQVSPLTHPGETAPEKLRNAIDTRQIVLSKEHKPKVYATFQDAVSARLRAVSLWPGDQMLSEEAATILMMRYVLLIPSGICI